MSRRQRRQVEPIPADAVRAWPCHALTPRGEVFRIEPNMGTWVGRRLCGTRDRRTGQRSVLLSTHGHTFRVYDVEGYAARLFGRQTLDPKRRRT